MSYNVLRIKEVAEGNLGKMRAEHFSVKSLFLDPNGIFSPAGHKNGVRAQRGKHRSAQSFLTAENQIGAVVFTYFKINNCVADNSLVVR